MWAEAGAAHGRGQEVTRADCPRPQVEGRLESPLFESRTFAGAGWPTGGVSIGRVASLPAPLAPDRGGRVTIAAAQPTSCGRVGGDNCLAGPFSGVGGGVSFEGIAPQGGRFGLWRFRAAPPGVGGGGCGAGVAAQPTPVGSR